MPFTDVQRVVAAGLQGFGHSDLGGGHAQVIEALGALGFVLVHDDRVQFVRVGVQGARHARHGTGRGGEFHPKAPGVTPGHERRA